jgi:hypothetical protein
MGPIHIMFGGSPLVYHIYKWMETLQQVLGIGWAPIESGALI